MRNDAFQTHKGGAGPAFVPPKSGFGLGQRFGIPLTWGLGLLLFVTIFSILSFSYHDKYDCFTVSTAGYVFCAFYAFPNTELRFRMTFWRWAPLLITSLSVLVATWLGEMNYEGRMRHYYDIKYGHLYTNVVPTNPAMYYPDASIIRFSDDSRVDTTRIVAGKYNEETYCAAPVVNDAPLDDSTPITFWATGKDCCQSYPPRFTCFAGQLEGTDADFRSVKTAMLATFERMTESDDRYYFSKTVKAGISRYSLPPLSRDDRIMLLQWSRDPFGDRDDFQRGGVIMFWIISLGATVFFIAMMIFARPGPTSAASPQWQPEKAGLVAGGLMGSSNLGQATKSRSLF